MIRLLRCIGILLGIFGWMLLWNCGGGSTSTTSEEAKDGRVLLQNDTSALLRVECYSDEIGMVKTDVPVKEKLDVSQKVLSAGSKVTLKIESEGSPEAHYDGGTRHSSFQTVELTVDGNTVVRMYGQLVGSNRIDYEILSE